MPGWYVHMEAAHEVGRRMRNGEIPAGSAISETEAKVIGEMCHTWRNYLALGAIGPDLFYLLPDYTGTGGMVIRDVAKWALDIWEAIDSALMAKWEKWIGPGATDRTQLASQLQGGLGPQLAQVLDEASSAVTTAFEGVLVRMADWFGFLTSGVPQGYGDDAFWSDLFQYRRTYQFPYAMLRRAMASLSAAADEDARQDAQAQVAFAVGWMSHCGTDVAGHPFTNAKCGDRSGTTGRAIAWWKTTLMRRTTARRTLDPSTASTARSRVSLARFRLMDTAPLAPGGAEAKTTAEAHSHSTTLPAPATDGSIIGPTYERSPATFTDIDARRPGAHITILQPEW